MPKPFHQVGVMRVMVTIPKFTGPGEPKDLIHDLENWIKDSRETGINYRELCNIAQEYVELLLEVVKNRQFRIDYMGMPDPEDTTKFTPEPIFFEIIDLEDKVSAVSQLVVGDHAAVQGSCFLLDDKGLRHFRVNNEPGVFDMTGQ